MPGAERKPWNKYSALILLPLWFPYVPRLEWHLMQCKQISWAGGGTVRVDTARRQPGRAEDRFHSHSTERLGKLKMRSAHLKLT